MARKHYRLHVTIPSYEGSVYSGDTEGEAMMVAYECYFQSDSPFLVDGHQLTLELLGECHDPDNCRAEDWENPSLACLDNPFPR